MTNFAGTRLMQPLITMEEYKKSVRYYADEQKDYLFHNKGDEHAKIIFENIFRTATKQIRIAAYNLWNSAVVNTPEYLGALKSYLDKPDTKLQILLIEEPSINDVLSESSYNIYRMLYEHPAYQSGRVEIKCGEGKSFKKDDKTIHFCTADGRMYRFESNPEQRSATCNFNDPNQTAILDSNFDRVFPQTTSVNLNTFFN